MLLSRLSPGTRYLLHLLYPPPCLDHDPFWAKMVLETRLQHSLPFFVDRQIEFMKFWKLGRVDLLRILRQYGYPGSDAFKSAISRIFEASKSDGDQLFRAYVSTELLYTLQLMVEYDRFGMIVPYLNYLTAHFHNDWSRIRVVDYGCGASDIGLLLAQLGAKVTIVDLTGGRSRFAEWRYQCRNLNVSCRSLDSTDDYAEFPEGSVDLFVATEVFEHVRNPLRLLKIAATALRGEGILFDSMAGSFDRETKGDHLIEAIEIGNSLTYKKLYENCFEHLTDTPSAGFNFVFRRRNGVGFEA
jgi:SAM-dependent methyltransferase